MQNVKKQLVNIVTKKRRKKGKEWSLPEQKEFLQSLSQKYNFQSIDDYSKLTIPNFIENRGKTLLKQYNFSITNLLSTSFPEHDWKNFENRRREQGFWNSPENQRKYLDYLFKELKLTSLDDWSKVSRKELKKYKPSGLLKHYSNNLSLAVSVLYPEHQWKTLPRIHNKYFILFSPKENKNNDENNSRKEIEVKNENREINNNNNNNIDNYNDNDNNIEERKIESLARNDKKIKMKMKKKKKKNEKVFLIKEEKIVKKNKKENKEDNNFNQLIMSQYDLQKKYKYYWKSNEYHVCFLEHIYEKLKMKSMEDWYLVQKKYIKSNGGERILLEGFNGCLSSLVISSYPNYPFDKFEFQNTTKFWQSVENQRQFLSYLFKKLNFKEEKDWCKVCACHFVKFKAKKFLKIYKFDLQNLFANFPEINEKRKQFYEKKKKFYWSDLKNQKNFLDNLFERLKFQNLNDWNSIKLIDLIHYGGIGLLRHYKWNLSLLFSTVYSNNGSIFWNFKKKLTTKEKLKVIQREFRIKREEDWYRIDGSVDKKLFQSLKENFPENKWKKEKFTSRSKKFNQFLLKNQLENEIFPNFLVIENYFYPHLSVNSDKIGEFDLFIPSLNLAIEYQGQHHFDDLPSGFSSLELYQDRDNEKDFFCKLKKITLLHIPYWWDLSTSSLLSFLRTHLSAKNLFKN